MRCLFYLLLTLVVVVVQSQSNTGITSKDPSSTSANEIKEGITSNGLPSGTANLIGQLEPPQNVTLEEVNSTSARLTWNALNHYGVELAEYLVNYIADNSEWLKKTTENCEVILPFEKEKLTASVMGVYKLNDGTDNTKNGKESSRVKLIKIPPIKDVYQLYKGSELVYENDYSAQVSLDKSPPQLAERANNGSDASRSIVQETSTIGAARKKENNRKGKKGHRRPKKGGDHVTPLSSDEEVGPDAASEGTSAHDAPASPVEKASPDGAARKKENNRKGKKGHRRPKKGGDHVTPLSSDEEVGPDGEPAAESHVPRGNSESVGMEVLPNIKLEELPMAFGDEIVRIPIHSLVISPQQRYVN
ncbi:unnamed protein product [Rodentolepis nana]|uniref:Fibronectin type-III domain-containing protein n=1 Tax=Rodentolepis nana TaxID=102285 RepID=A0A0R3TPQ8_RODNA|nr:unnamed protein product [Rodentolepis nana]